MMRKKTLYSIAAGLLCATLAHAGTATFDFNTDPSLNGSFTNYGNAAWYPDFGVTGAAGDGWLEVTAALGSQGSTVLFEDFDAGSVVKAFTFDMDLRVGNGTANPADGFSINYVRINDPALANALATVGGPFSPQISGWAGGPQCEANLPEEGSQTGLAIGFDAWNSGGTAPYCDGLGVASASNIGPDVIGLSVRVDGILIAQFPMPTQNGSVTDPTSLQTGPNVPAQPGDPTVLGWAHLKVDLGDTGLLNVYWKGFQLLTNYQTTYFPSAGRLMFTGRTGGSNQNQDVDNITITTIPAATALVGQAVGSPDGFTITISDSGTSVVDTTTVTAKLNGSAAAPLTVTKNGGTTTVIYHGYPTLLPVGSTNTVDIVAQDTLGNPVTGTQQFVVGPYGSIPAGDAVTGVNTTLPGFTVLPWQSGANPNTVYWTLEQLAGLHGANNAAFTVPTTSTSLVNYNVTPLSAGGADAGNFTTANGYPDALFPGIPGLNGINDNTALNAQCFLQFDTAGVYSMGVNSDDGFLVSEGKNPNDWFNNWLGLYNGGRGSSDTIFTFVVNAPGIYPVRMAWQNGGGGANCEWFTVKNGVKTLINDPSPGNASGVKAFYSGPALPAFVSAVQPNPNSGNNLPDSVLAQLTDGGTTVSAGAQLYVNGVLTSPTSTKVGPVTTLKLALPTSNLLPQGANNAALVWSDSGGAAHSNYWAFTVAAYATLDIASSTPLGSQDVSKPGFVLKVAQIDFTSAGDPGDGMANQMDSANNLIAGLWFPYYGTNVADVTDSYYGGINPAATGNTWYWSNAVDFAISGSTGDFPFDYTMPGIPGLVVYSLENLAASFQTYLVFPTAGFYRMGVSSDDGFRLSGGFNLLRQALHVTGSAVNTDVMATVSQRTGGANQLGIDLPVVPIVAEVVNVNSNTWASSASAFPNVSGKIAAIATYNNGGLNGVNNQLLTYIAQTNGAVGVIFLYNPGWGTVGTIGGSAPAPITIPVLAVSGFGGLDQLWYTNGTLTATIGASQAVMLGSADYGKGMGWVDFGFVVPQAGVYPLNLIYEQGGGGAGLEWCHYLADGTRALVNDLTNPNSLVAFRAVTVEPAPTISVGKVGNAYVITYTGTLQSSSTPGGTYTAVPGASSPYTIPTSAGPQQFYKSGN
jgi:hypothetical protein